MSTKQKLFKHQEVGVEFLKKKEKCILADEMGLGKTRQSIIASHEKDDQGVKLIIVPASLKINWEREIKMIYPDQGVFTIQSGPEVDIPKKDWVILNYDMLKKYKDQILSMKDEIKTCIIDEAHYIKGKKAIRSKITLEIVKELDQVYCLTGTPIQNRPVELFNLLRAIDHPLGKRKSFYSKRYCGGHLRTIVKKNGQVIRFWDESGATNLPELRALTSDVILRRTKDEVLDLPEKMISVEIVDLNRLWQKEYDQAWDKYLEWITQNPEGKDIDNIMSAQALVELMKLKQVCSEAKIDRIVSDIQNAVDQDSKVIVFSQFTNTIKLLREKLQDKAIPSVRLTGQDKMEERQKSVDEFQNNSAVKVFVGNIMAAGVGLNLTAASQVMFADMDWSPAVHDQATDRAHRIGQKGTVNVYYYVAVGTIEEDIVDILQSKLKTIKTILEGGDAIEDAGIGKEFLKRLKSRINQ